MASGSDSRSTSFGSVVDAYDRGRPDYPAAAIEWLIGEGPLSVLELGAGTGKLTQALVAAGHDVHATDPDASMLDRLSDKLPELRISQATAEDIPAGDASYDVVVAAQAYHWFDHEVALPEIARVLKRGGALALVWNIRDERIPWVKRLGRIFGEEVHDGTPGKELETSRYYGPIEEKTFKHWQVVDRHSILDLTRSRSNVAALDEAEREAKLAEVLAFYDDFGRGMDGMQIPYLTRCFRAVLGIRPEPKHPPVQDESGVSASSTTGDGSTGGDGVSASSTTGDGSTTADGSTGGAGVSASSTTGDGSTGGDRSTTGEGSERRGLVDPPTDDDSGVLLIDFR